MGTRKRKSRVEKPPSPVAEAKEKRRLGAARSLWTVPSADSARPAWADTSTWGKRAWMTALVLGCVAAVFRAIQLTTRSVWFDEIHTLTDAQWIPPEGRTHWMFFRVVSVFLRVFGDNELGLRLFGFVTGVLGVICVTLWVWRLSGWCGGVLAGVALATARMHIAYSQEARYYAPMVLYSAVLLLTSTEFFLSRGRRRWLWAAGCVGSAWLALGNHVTSAAMSLALGGWVIGCLAFTPWGRRLVARWVAGPGPLAQRWNLRTLAAIFLVVVVSGALAWKAWNLYQAHKGSLSLTQHTSGVTMSWEFWDWNLSEFSASATREGAVALLGSIIWECAFVAGLVWLFRYRRPWGSLIVWLVATAFVAVFVYPVKQEFDPKYIAFLFPLRVAAVGIGLWWGLSWMGARIRRLASRQNAVAIAAGLLVLIVAASPGWIGYYGKSRTPLRPAMTWLKEHADPSDRIASYGHTNYGVEFYARRLGMNPEQFVLLRWPSESGVLDLGLLRGRVPRDGTLYFVHGWPYDVPEQLKAAYGKDLEEVVRFASSRGTELDTVVYRWVGGGWDHSGGESIEIPVFEIARRSWQGKLDDREFEGRPALRFLRNTWVEYNVDLDPGSVYRVWLRGFDPPEGGSSFEVSLDDGFAGVITYSGGLGQWVEKGFAFRAKRRPTTLRLYLISEVDDAWGQQVMGVGGAFDRVRFERIAEEDAADVDHRLDLARLLTPLPDGVPEYASVDTPGQPAEMWLSLPEMFDVKLEQGADAAMSDRLRIRLLPPYNGSIMSPAFYVEPGKLLYLRMKAQTREVYGLGAALFLGFYDAAGNATFYFPTEGNLQDDINWDFVYRWRRPDLQKTYTWLIGIAPETAGATVGVIVWPGSMPLRTPTAEILLEPPVTPDSKPDLLNR